MENFSSGRRFC
uniref:Uncharacterized protein n=1 Tax=Rhizophora mucronata TaxID=61149 RepID=A0A2P2N6G4_RHIMU